MQHHKPKHRGRVFSRRRNGKVIVFFALLLVMLMAMIAFAVDVGYMFVGRAQSQIAVDAGAMAGAAMLAESPADVEAEAIRFAQANLVYSANIPAGDIQVKKGDWDTINRTFRPTNNHHNAVRVSAAIMNRPLYFARAMGNDSFDLRAEAVASYQPRDIVVVLDYSASMNDDSEFRHVDKLGESAILANLLEIYNDLGRPKYGTLKWNTKKVSSSNSNAAIIAYFGLDTTPYPYPSGSWSDYVSYVKTNGYLKDAGYRDQYGYPTLINYWLERKPKYDEIPDLWKTSEQPVTAVKNALTLFLAYIEESNVDDRIGLSIYTAADGTAVLEHSLTRNFTAISTTANQRQAGHYDQYTNIGAGVSEAIDELDSNSRPIASKLIVLMTDGIANRPRNPGQAKAYVRQQAQRASAAGYPIVTISLGVAADAALMQEVADITDGVHFNIPGGSSVAEYEADLRDVFKQIADYRKLRLVK